MESSFDDPIWEYTLVTKLSPYIPDVRKFWNNIATVQVTGTGVFQIDSEQPGLMYRVTNTPVRSPIKHIQVFPFVPVAYLQLQGIKGGANKMVERVCKHLEIEEFTCIQKSNLPSTYHSGQLIAFVPTEILRGTQQLGKWIYFTIDELLALRHADLPKSVHMKLTHAI